MLASPRRADHSGHVAQKRIGPQSASSIPLRDVVLDCQLAGQRARWTPPEGHRTQFVTLSLRPCTALREAIEQRVTAAADTNVGMSKALRDCADLSVLGWI